MTRLMKAQDEERRRIARELHDSAGQTLTVLGLSLAQLVERAQVIAPELAKEGKEIEASGSTTTSRDTNDLLSFASAVTGRMRSRVSS